MADNTTLNVGSGGDSIRDLDRSGVKTQIVALDLNPSGSETLMAGAMPVTAAALPLPAGAATAVKQPAIGTAGAAAADVITVQGIDSMTALKVDGSAATQPVSGAVTANIGTSGSLALDATLTGGTQKSKLVDSGGTNVAIVSAGGALKVDGSAATQPVSGTVTANIGTSGSLALDATLTGGTQKSKLVDSAGTNVAIVSAGGALKVDGSGVTQPISGTVTANIGTSGSLALDATLTGGTQKSKLVDSGGTNVATVSAGGALKVDGSGVTQPVSGTVTANAGTGAFTVAQATAANLNATVVGTGTFAVQATQSGTWNVGTVTTVSAVTAITNPLPAGTNLLGRMAASPETSTIYNGTTAITPKFALISASASGATTVIAAVAGKQLRVLRWSLRANGNVNIKWQSHVTPTDLTGLRYLTQYASDGGAFCPLGLFQTVAGEALDLNLSAAIAVGGELTYVEV